MPTPQRAITHSVESATLADVLERVLDMGVVIAGDIKIKLVDVELLTIQIRLLIASVDKAKEMGVDWWATNPAFSSHARPVEEQNELAALRQRLDAMEARYGATTAPVESGSP
ncbi:MAG: gas vesicle protein [Planctomycetes bacterium]|nr:gas vesicle protein [Planctomycetota bacterium]